MKLIVFSTPDRSLSEAKDVTEMFKLGLKHFHLKKSSFEKHEMEEYIKSIPTEFHKYIVLHTNHQLRSKFKLGGLHISRTHRKKKYNSWWKMFKLQKFSRLKFTRTFNKISTLSAEKKKYDYVFLSPIYDSISKLGHSGNFGNRSMEKYVQMSKSPVVALGGVDLSKFEECKKIGFDGVAVLGYIWNNPELNPVDAFKMAKQKLNTL